MDRDIVRSDASTLIGSSFRHEGSGRTVAKNELNFNEACSESKPLLLLEIELS